MRAEFQYMFDDFRQAQALLRKSNRRRSGRYRLYGWLLFVGLAVMLVFLVRNSRSSGPATPAPMPPAAAAPPAGCDMPRDVLLPLIPWVVIFGFVWLFVYRQMRTKVKRAWDASPALHRPWTIEADDAGIVLAEPLPRLQFAWDAFDRFEESPDLFVLYLENQSAHMVPKRALAGPQEVSRFRDLLGRMAHKRTGGFPVLIVPPPMGSRATQGGVW